MKKYILKKQFPDVHAGTVKWPMSVIRLQGENTEYDPEYLSGQRF